MRWRPAAVVLPVLALAIGCASTGDTQWVKANVTDEQKERDKSECLRDSTDVVASPQGPRPRTNQDRYRRCLEERGYRLQQTPASR